MAVAEGTVCTPDGRALAYAQMGQLDGAPLLYFHGVPGSRMDWDYPLNRPALDGSGVRLIGIDRPGFGGSTHQPQRRYADWPADVLTVVNELELDRFAILGYSGGAPYAIACALAFPERLTFVGIVSGVGPADTPRFEYGMGKRMIRLFRRAPAVARGLIRQIFPTSYSRGAGGQPNSADRAMSAAVEEFIADAYAEATRNGPQGLVEDLQLLDAPSELNYPGVQCPVQLWHGESDDLVPLRHAEHVAKLVPKAHLEVLPRVGHFPDTDLWRAVLQAAVTSTSW